MRNNLFKLPGILFFISVLFLTSCTQSAVEIRLKAKNNLQIKRSSETISLDLADLLITETAMDPAKLFIRDSQSGQTIISQLIDLSGDGVFDEIIFQSDFDPLEEKKFVLSESAKKNQSIKSKVYARFVPTRKDDFAWENDRIAFRMYGPALETEGEISSGVDVWVKNVPDLILDKWYQPGNNYHKDHGEGLDYYKVGPSRGCGGTALWTDNKMIPSNNFQSWEILANGPVRVIFKLSYAPIKVGDSEISEVKLISLDAGQNLNRFENTYGINEGIPVAIGIVKRDGGNKAHHSKEQGWMTYWEPEYKKNGSTGCAIVIDSSTIIGVVETEDHSLVISNINSNNRIMYYAGAGWSKSGTFDSEQEWQNYVQNFALALQSPIKIEIVK